MSFVDPSDPRVQSGGSVSASGLGTALAPNPGTGAGGGTGFGSGFNLPSYQTLGSLFNTVNLPGQVQSQNQVSNLQNRLGLSGAMAGIQRGQLNQDAGMDRQRLGLQRALLGDQKKALGRTEEDINYNADRQIENFMGGQAARGASQTQGTRRGVGDFERQRWRGIENLNLDRNQLARAATNLGLDEQELGTRLDRALEQLGLSQALEAQDILQAITDVEAGRFNPISQLLGAVYQLSGVRPVAGQEGPTTGSSPTPSGQQLTPVKIGSGPTGRVA